MNGNHIKQLISAQRDGTYSGTRHCPLSTGSIEVIKQCKTRKPSHNALCSRVMHINIDLNNANYYYGQSDGIWMTILSITSMTNSFNSDSWCRSIFCTLMKPSIILLLWLKDCFKNSLFVCVFVLFFLLTLCPFRQQYVMLHDMVAAHSVVRVSVCSGNKGRSQLITHRSTNNLLLDLTGWFGSDFEVLWPRDLAPRRLPGHVHGARPRRRHRGAGQRDDHALRRRARSRNLHREREHADRWGSSSTRSPSAPTRCRSEPPPCLQGRASRSPKPACPTRAWRRRPATARRSTRGTRCSVALRSSRRASTPASWWRLWSSGQVRRSTRKYQYSVRVTDKCSCCHSTLF